MNAVTVKDGITPSLTELAEQFPREFRKGLMDLASRYKRRMAQEIRAGHPAGVQLAPLDPITLELKAKQMLRVKTTRKTMRRAIREGWLNYQPKIKNLARFARQQKGFGGRIPDLSEYDLQTD